MTNNSRTEKQLTNVQNRYWRSIFCWKTTKRLRNYQNSCCWISVISCSLKTDHVILLAVWTKMIFPTLELLKVRENVCLFMDDWTDIINTLRVEKWRDNVSLWTLSSKSKLEMFKITDFLCGDLKVKNQRHRMQQHSAVPLVRVTYSSPPSLWASLF